ncbi:MAG: phosphoenolpyruvate--protein phosphotransferase [Armatimonadota bacterium]
MLKGLSVSKGIAISTAFWHESIDILKIDKVEKTEDSSGELKKLEEGINTCREELSKLKENISNYVSKEEAAIFDIQALFLEDPMIVDEIKELIENGKYTASSALVKIIKQRTEEFEQIEDEYFKARAADLLDMGSRLFLILEGEEDSFDKEHDDSFILASVDLLPSQTAKLDKSKIKGIITRKGGVNSHAAILARSLAIPCVMGVKDLDKSINGKEVILDGDKGEVYSELTGELLKSYKEKIEKEKEIEKAREKFIGKKAVTGDGLEINILANINEVEDLDTAVYAGVDGVGLFRTEFIYIGKEKLPSLEEQVSIYKEAIEKISPGTVTFRTLDIGSDKPLKNYEFEEENPALGVRGIRWSFNYEEILKTQLKAMLMASCGKKVKIMFPMVSLYEEVVRAKNLVNKVCKELKEEGAEFNDEPSLGIMLETPAASVTVDILGKELDFFSIGSNDLTQYTLAVDRMNEEVQDLYSTLQPSVLRLIDIIVKASDKHKKELSICGEAASDPECVPVLIGLSLRSLSVNASAVLAVKELISRLNSKECILLAQEALFYKV